MAPRRTYVPHLPIPEDYWNHLQWRAKLDEFGHLRAASSREEHRNHLTSWFLREIHGLVLDRHGGLFGSDAHIRTEPHRLVEFKSSYQNDPGVNKTTRFYYGEVSVETLSRHLTENHIFSRFRDVDGLDHLVEVWSLPVGSKLHDFLRQERVALMNGMKKYTMRFSMDQIKNFGAYQLI